MWEALCRGVTIYKHGKKGKPKEKLLYCDKAMTTLYWRNPGSKALTELDEEEPDNEGRKLHEGIVRRRSGLLAVMMGQQEGGRRSSITKADVDRMISFKDIVAIYNDCRTEVMIRCNNKGLFVFSGAPIISIVTPKRTLDMELDDDSWNALYYGFEILIDYYQRTQHSPMAAGAGGASSPSAAYIQHKESALTILKSPSSAAYEQDSYLETSRSKSATKKSKQGSHGYTNYFFGGHNDDEDNLQSLT